MLNVFKENNELIKLEKDNYSVSTLGQYCTTLERLASFVKKEYGVADIKMKNLDLLFIRKFDLYLKLEYYIL